MKALIVTAVMLAGVGLLLFAQQPIGGTRPQILFEQPVTPPDPDAERQLIELEQEAASHPEQFSTILGLAFLYAEAIHQDGPLAVRAQSGLDASTNVWVVGNAAYKLQTIYNDSRQAGRPDVRAKQLAERYFEAALKLDPTLERAKILPEIDLEAIAAAKREAEQQRLAIQARLDAAVGEIRRLAPAAFRDAPSALIRTLDELGCAIPQGYLDPNPNNLIQGSFFSAEQQESWAVLCSDGTETRLLAFRDALDRNPMTLRTQEDRGAMMLDSEDRILYSRGISTVGPDYILRHYQGNPQQPPPLTHQAIDDAFLEKASTTWYFHEGEWLPLQGAD